MQQYGQPPAEIMKDLAPGLKFDEEGMPIMPNMGGPGMPSTSFFSFKNSTSTKLLSNYACFCFVFFIFLTNFLLRRFLIIYTVKCVYLHLLLDGEGMPDIGNLSNLMATGQCSIS